MGFRGDDSLVSGGVGDDPKVQALLEPKAEPVMKEVVVDMPDSKQMVEEAMLLEER